MFKLFNRRSRPTREVAPSLTAAEQRQWQVPGPVAGSLPDHTYTAMMSDGMVHSALAIKRLAVLASDWRITGQDARRVAFIERVFAQMEGSPRTILTQAMDAFGRGWSVQEQVYRAEGGQVWLAATRAKDVANLGLRPDEFGRVEALTMQRPGEPEHHLDPRKFIVYRHHAGTSRLKGRSDLDAAYRHFQAKNTLLQAWRIHLERYASPTMLGKFERGLPPEEQSKLLGALNQLADATAIVFPREVEVESVAAAPEASRGFMEAIDFHNREMARAILGQTLTTDEGRRVGSLALGKVHLQVLLLQVNAVRETLADEVMTEQVIRPLIEMNFGPGEIPRFQFDNIRLEAFASGNLG
ncbi:MAG: DUF935 family protein [Chthonomonas sp.]|nr:DUF935 family protein [Chthonomonas sp.]